jgi:preprotein translocase subunit SecY
MRTGLKKPSKIVKPIKQLQAPIRLKQPTTAIKSHYSATSSQRVEGIHRSSQIKHFSQHHYPESPRWGVSSPAEPGALPTAKIIDSVTQQTNKLQNIIGRGLQKATSHDQPNPVHQGLKHKRKKTKFRIFNTVVASLAVILILGFIVYKSMPDIDVRIASAKSGVHAEIPGYIPTGFKFVGPVKYGQGTVTVIFTSKTGSFRVVQQNSTWDSVGLRDNFVSTIDPNFKVVQAGGRIVYLYSQANATWVNGGIWYQITDNADLSTASLLKIVTSL